MTPEEEWEEQGLLAAAMRQIGDGDASGLVALLRRGKPVSPAVADFIGAMLAGQDLNGFAFRLEQVPSRGRPKTGETRVRQMKAIYYMDHLVRQGVARTDAARDAAGKFKVDHDVVRKRHGLLSHLSLPAFPEYARAVAEAEDNPD